MPAGGDLGVSVGTAADGGAELGLDVLEIGADIARYFASTRVRDEVCERRNETQRNLKVSRRSWMSDAIGSRGHA